MSRTKEKGISHKITFSKKVDDRLMQVLAKSRTGISGFVEDAVVQRLARWESADTFIDRKRKKLGFTEQSVFDLKLCHPSGLPKGKDEPADVQNLINLVDAAPDLAYRDMNIFWEQAGLGMYGDKQWAATLEWVREQ